MAASSSSRTACVHSGRCEEETTASTEHRESDGLRRLLGEVVDEENITLLFRAESVLIASPQNNITAKVVDRLNKLTSAAAASE